MIIISKLSFHKINNYLTKKTNIKYNFFYFLKYLIKIIFNFIKINKSIIYKKQLN